MKTKLLFLLLISINNSFAQDIQTELVSTKKLKADIFLGVDEFDELYYVKNNILYKIREKDTINYSNPQYGDIYQVNIQNPLKLVLFYKDFNVAVFLDNNLNELSGTIDFTRETFLNNVIYIGISSENNLWLYADDTKLHLYDFQNRIEKVQTQPISFYEDGFSPINMKSSYKNVWVLSNSGIIQFNEYGNFIQKINITEATNIFPAKNYIIYLKNKNLFKIEKNKSIPININYNKLIKNTYIINNYVYFYDGEYIYQYKFL